MSPNANTINDFIVGKSFEQDMFDPDTPMRAEGNPLFERDVVDGEFERIHAKKSRRNKMLIAIGVLVVVAGSFFAVVRFAPSLLGLAPPPVVAFPMAAAGGSPADLPQQAVTPATANPPAAAVELPPDAAPPPVETAPQAPAESPFQNAEPQQPVTTPPAAPVVAEATPTPSPKPVQKTAPPVKQPATKPITVAPKNEPKKPSVETPASGSSAGQGSVTPVVTLSSAQMGVRSFSADSVVVQAAGGDVKSYRVGDSLPNGEKLQKLDPTTMTMVTDRRVIRIK